MKCIKFMLHLNKNIRVSMSPFDNITLSFDDLIMSIDIAKNEIHRLSSVIWKDTKIEKINYDNIWKY